MQGYGQVTLKNVLMTSKHCGFDLFVYDVLMMMSQRIISFSVSVTSPGPLKATLVGFVLAYKIMSRNVFTDEH